jgi:hypothetical protein
VDALDDGVSGKHRQSKTVCAAAKDRSKSEPVGK